MKVSDTLFRSGTVLTTFKCTAHCENCCFSKYLKDPEKLSFEDIKKFVDEISKLPNIELICFSGGEPTLLGDDLLKSIEYCTQKGFVTRIVSNGWWAKDDETTYEFLKKLNDAGLKELNFSTGDQHGKYVDIENVIRGISIWVNSFKKVVAINVEQPLEADIGKFRIWSDKRIREIMKNDKLRDLCQIAESVWMPVNDDKEEVVNPVYWNEENLEYNHGGCETLFSTMAYNAKKELILCCGLTSMDIPELKYEMKEDISDIIADAYNDTLLKWIKIDGPIHILNWAKKYDETINWENRFSHICDSCKYVMKNKSIRKLISSNQDGIADQVEFRYKSIHNAISKVNKIKSKTLKEASGYNIETMSSLLN